MNERLLPNLFFAARTAKKKTRKTHFMENACSEWEGMQLEGASIAKTLSHVYHGRSMDMKKIWTTKGQERQTNMGSLLAYEGGHGLPDKPRALCPSV